LFKFSLDGVGSHLSLPKVPFFQSFAFVYFNASLDTNRRRLDGLTASFMACSAISGLFKTQATLLSRRKWFRWRSSFFRPEETYTM